MMICPETFYEMNLKGKSEKEILSVIRGLKQRIGKLKNIVEHPNYELRSMVIHPTERVQIICCQGYLERAKEALAEVGGSYIPTAAEQKATAFDENIPNIGKVVFSIGGYFSGRETRTFIVEDDKVKIYVERFLISEVSDVDVGEIEELEKEEFFEQLKALRIGEWRKKYDTRRFNISVSDGIQWELKIYYSDNSRTVKICGDNAYPYNFDRLLDFFEIENISL